MKWDETINTTEHFIDRSDGSKLKILEIAHKDAEPDCPIILYFHGGAFFMTYMLGHLKMIQAYALHVKARVFVVDYRLSGSHPFPAPFEDCYQSLKWLNDHSKDLGINADNILLAGDSAGGALAASVSQKVKDDRQYPIRAQCLIYPVIDCDMKTKSATEFTDAKVWNTKNNRLMWSWYLKGSDPENTPRYASPIHHPDLTGQPPAYIEVAELDPLCDEALNYTKALRAVGVDVEENFIAGAIHGFDYAPMCDPIKNAMAARIAFFKRHAL